MLLSIIIPCYNSSPFIAKTLDMLITQGLDECEIIIINDGSTDNTSEIVHQYENRISHVKIIDKENEGVSVARNMGLNIASGEYIYFLDSDDTLTDGTLEYYKETLKRNPTIDLFSFGYKTRRNGKDLKKYIYSCFDNKILNNEQLIKNFFLKKLGLNICGCIFKRNIILDNQIQFNKGQKIGEDIVFIMRIISVTTNFIYSARVCFIYLIRDDSAMKKPIDYTIDKYNVLNYYINTQNLFKNTQKEFNYFICCNIIVHIKRYISSNLIDDNITSNLIEKTNWFKKKIAIGNPKFTLIIYLARILPLKLIIRIFK